MGRQNGVARYIYVILCRLPPPYSTFKHLLVLERAAVAVHVFIWQKPQLGRFASDRAESGSSAVSSLVHRLSQIGGCRFEMAHL